MMSSFGFRLRALRVMKTIQDACAETGTPVSVCGEMAGRPLEAFALVALGFILFLITMVLNMAARLLVWAVANRVRH